MSLLIDGYNLLHATDIFGDEGSAPSFQRSREALLAFLAKALHEVERLQTTIVFDAAGAPPGLPHTDSVAGLQVRYARDYPDADALLEELIEEHPAPRGLLVVSSDHRVQRAARRRGAKYCDSDRWYAELCRRPLRSGPQRAGDGEKPAQSAAEIAYWMRQFEPAEPFPPSAPPEQPADQLGAQPPFPPGYADDLLADEPS